MNGIHADNSMVGASFLSKRSAENARQMLLALADANKGVSKDDLFKLFRAELEADTGYQRAVDWYFFVNFYSYEFTNRSGNLRAQSAEARQHKQEIVNIIHQQLVLLDLTMPNGKPMKECSGAEMAKFGSRFQKVAERVGKTKTVGSVLSEEQVKTILT